MRWQVACFRGKHTELRPTQAELLDQLLLSYQWASCSKSKLGAVLLVDRVRGDEYVEGKFEKMDPPTCFDLRGTARQCG